LNGKSKWKPCEKYLYQIVAKPNVVLKNGNRPKLLQCGKEGVVLYGLRYRDMINVKDDDVEIIVKEIICSR